MPECSVFVVEDDPIIVRILLSMLREENFNLETPVNSGEQALEQVIFEKPDIVLMDIDLPGLISGIDAASMLFNIFTIPVIFVTGHDERSILDRAIQSLPFGFLVKPVSPYLLINTIRISISLCSRMRQTTQGKAAGLSPSIRSSIQEYPGPLLLINGEDRVIWINQATEELFDLRSQEVFMQNISAHLNGRLHSAAFHPAFFADTQESEMPCSFVVNSQRYLCKIHREPITNLFGDYSGSLVAIDLHDR